MILRDSNLTFKDDVKIQTVNILYLLQRACFIHEWFTNNLFTYSRSYVRTICKYLCVKMYRDRRSSADTITDEGKI